MLVEGAFRRPFQEEFREGQSQGVNVDAGLEKNILQVHCPECQVCYIYEPPEVYQLRERVVQLEMMLAPHAVPQANQRIN